MVALCADTVTSIGKRSDRFLVYFHLDGLRSMSISSTYMHSNNNFVIFASFLMYSMIFDIPLFLNSDMFIDWLC